MGERSDGDCVRAFAVRLHQIECSLRETIATVAELGVERSRGAVWNEVRRLTDSGCDPPEAQPKRIAVDETTVKVNGEWSWLYAAIDTETKLILDVVLFGRCGADPAAAFLHRLKETYELSEAEFLVDQFGYRTALSRLGLSGRVSYTERNLIEKRFHTLKIRVDRFRNSWVGSRGASVSGLNSFCTTTTVSDPTELSMERRRSRRCSTRQCRLSKSLRWSQDAACVARRVTREVRRRRRLASPSPRR